MCWVWAVGSQTPRVFLGPSPSVRIDPFRWYTLGLQQHNLTHNMLNLIWPKLTCIHAGYIGVNPHRRVTHTTLKI